MAIRRPWRLEVLIPVLLGVAFLVDVGCRFVRVDALTFRAEEGLIQFRSAWLPGPYEPNRYRQSEAISGDLPSMSNRPDYRVFREQSFTTDDLGFRNASSGRPTAPPSVLMVGSSFTVGVGNTDSQTLPSQVEALSGCPTSNAGDLDIRSESILRVARARGMRQGLIVVESLERYVGVPILPRRGRLKWVPYRDDLLAIAQTIGTRLDISPVKLACRRVYKALQNDRILPNVYKEAVAVRPLRDGRPMLFLLDLEKPNEFVDPITQNVDAYVKIRDELKAAGFDLALTIVPDKLTVYRALLRDPLPVDGKSSAILAELERSCRARGLTILNLAPLLIEGARQALDKGEVMYWPDDTHWNPRGIAIAARAITDSFGLRDRCASKPDPAGSGR